jgi:hypothetical protein
MRRILLALFALTFVVGLGFIGAILENLGNGVALHEVAGLVLLVLLVLTLWSAVRLRPINPRPVPRVVVALVALVVAAATGGSLATGVLAGAWAGLPLIPLVVMLVAVADGIRVTVEFPSPPPETAAAQRPDAG